MFFACVLWNSIKIFEKHQNIFSVKIFALFSFFLFLQFQKSVGFWRIKKVSGPLNKYDIFPTIFQQKLFTYPYEFIIKAIFEWQFSRVEICVANFIPPANGASQGNYFLPKSHKLAVFEEKWAYKNSSGSHACKFWFCLDERSNKLL